VTAAQPTRAAHSLGASQHPNLDGLLDSLAERVADVVTERLAAQGDDGWLDSAEAAERMRLDPRTGRKRVSEVVRSGDLRCARDGTRSDRPGSTSTWCAARDLRVFTPGSHPPRDAALRAGPWPDERMPYPEVTVPLSRDPERGSAAVPWKWSASPCSRSACKQRKEDP
jgi:hypothetical protein